MVIANQRAIATCRSATGTASAMIAKTHRKNSPRCHAADDAGQHQYCEALRQSTEMETKMITAKQVTISRILPTMSASDPKIGCTKANGRANAVDSKATLAASTARSPAMEGISGSSARADSAVAKPIALTCVMSWLGGEGALGGRHCGG